MPVSRERIPQQIIISGVGGQGVLFLTRLLAQSALEQGLDVISSETHGMAMRGGSVVSHVKVGAFHSPLIRSGCADLLLALDRSHWDLSLHFLHNRGIVILNSQSRENMQSRALANRVVISIDATRLAAEMGSPRIANVVLLGFALAKNVLFCPVEAVETALRQITTPGRVDGNLMALKAGLYRGRG